MKNKTDSPDEYVSGIEDPEKQKAFKKLREVILKNLPKGFRECMNYGMIGYVVPHSVYPDGYHCNPELPLPFVCIASQKHFIAVYHMGIYANPVLMKWFTEEHKKRVSSKLDMGKSCIRYKKTAEIPFGLIGELIAKISADEWIKMYESAFKSRKKNVKK